MTGSDAACLGKHRFFRWSDAEKIASRQRREGRGPVHVFRCPHCGKYHLGTDPVALRLERIAYRRLIRTSSPSEEDLEALRLLQVRTRHLEP